MRQRTIVLQLILGTGLAASIVAAALQGAAARSRRPPCDKIRAAVAAGRTMDQLIAEFDTDAEQVTKCLQTRGRRRKSTAAKKQAHTKTKKKSEHTTSDLKRQGRESSEENKPASEQTRPRLPPSHPFGPHSVP